MRLANDGAFSVHGNIYWLNHRLAASVDARYAESITELRYGVFTDEFFELADAISPGLVVPC